MIKKSDYVYNNDCYYYYFGKIKLYVNIMTAYIIIGKCIGFLWLAEMFVWLRLLFLNDRWFYKRPILLISVFTVDIKSYHISLPICFLTVHVSFIHNSIILSEIGRTWDFDNSWVWWKNEFVLSIYLV